MSGTPMTDLKRITAIAKALKILWHKAIKYDKINTYHQFICFTSSNRYAQAYRNLLIRLDLDDPATWLIINQIKMRT